jgi:hypothetical protein
VFYCRRDLNAPGTQLGSAKAECGYTAVQIGLFIVFVQKLGAERGRPNLIPSQQTAESFSQEILCIVILLVLFRTFRGGIHYKDWGPHYSFHNGWEE